MIKNVTLTTLVSNSCAGTISVANCDDHIALSVPAPAATRGLRFLSLDVTTSERLESCCTAWLEVSRAHARKGASFSLPSQLECDLISGHTSHIVNCGPKNVMLPPSGARGIET